MNAKDRKTAAWAAGIVAVVLVVWGIWWVSTRGGAGSMATSTASTTADVASTTPQNTKPAVEQSASTVNGIIANLPNTTIANAIFTQSGVAASTAGKGPYTVFVPTNEAFSYLPQGTVSNMTSAQLKHMVQYHVIAGRALDADAVVSGSVQTLSKDYLNIQVNLQTGRINVQSGYVLKEYKASNGVVFLISGVLIPPQKTQ